MKRNVELPAPAVRIVCLSEAHTENLVAIRGVRQLAGVVFSTDSRWVFKGVPRLSRNPSAEQIIEQKPDLVLLETSWAEKNKTLLKELDMSKVPYVVLNRPKWGQMGEYLDKLGALSGRSRDAARALIFSEKILHRAKLRADKMAMPRVFVVAAADFSSCAPDSWGAKLIIAAGGAPIVGTDCIPVERDPQFVFYGPQRLARTGNLIDVIITLTDNGRGMPAVSKDAIMKDPRFKNIPAVKNSRVWEMKEADLMLPSLIRLDSSLVTCFKYMQKKL
ncbi:MAG: ABC transporter substrate-binding protein [Synergistaceae bacterium]|nr:ABC transporter substrate-binding protein [Synergistaceae bacterium]